VISIMPMYPLFPFTGNKGWVLLISQEIKKCMGIIDITGNKGWVLLISQEIKKMHGLY
jgi:hypothetical protein